MICLRGIDSLSSFFCIKLDGLQTNLVRSSMTVRNSCKKLYVMNEKSIGITDEEERECLDSQT